VRLKKRHNVHAVLRPIQIFLVFSVKMARDYGQAGLSFMLASMRMTTRFHIITADGRYTQFDQPSDSKCARPAALPSPAF